MTTEAGRSRSGARWGWLLTTLALGIALGGTSWANYRSVRGAVSTLDLGQIRVFEQLVRNALAGSPSGGPFPDLDSLVAAYEDEGLRFVGTFSPEQGLVVLGGTPAADPVVPPSSGGAPEPTRVGNRIRALLPGPRPRAAGSAAAPDLPAAQGPPDTRDELDREGRLGLVVEFEPVVAGQLEDRALRSLIMGTLAAGLLMLTALFFWRATIRQEADERTMEERRRLSTLGEFSAILAHEIRNPLASLKGHAQLLAERIPDEAPEGGRVRRIVREAQRLEDLTVDLLDFVRTGPLDLVPVDVERFLGAAVSASGSDAVRLDTTRAPERWAMDAKRMHQVLANLLSNAVEATPPGAPIDVTAALEGTSLVLSFRDRGEGIADENLERIFEPFFTTRARGTGLGLAVARRIVELHGGTLTGRSVPGGGAEFRVTLTPRRD